MRASIPYIKEKFDEFNKQMFGGKLKPVPFKLSHARSFLGQIRCNTLHDPITGMKYHGDFVFVISDGLDVDEDVVEDIIIHEMIHYYIMSNQIQDTSPHGEEFRKMMNDINTKFHRHVAVRYSMTAKDLDRDTIKREHSFAIVRFKGNSQLGIIIPTETKIFDYWDILEKSDRVEECKWYFSYDPFFNRFPKTRTMKIYNISDAEVKEHLKGARELKNYGNYIYFKDFENKQ